MNDFATDELARRLATLEPRVDPAIVTRRVLGVRHEPRAGRVRRLASAAAAAPVILLIAAVVSSYFAPVFAQAVADAPIAGGVTGRMLREVGLAGVPHRVSIFGDAASSSGYGVELVGGYADSGRTILFLRVTPAAGIAPQMRPGQQLSLTDQFGQSYRFTGGMSDFATGESTLIFEPLRWPASAVGARLRLTFDAIAPDVARPEDEVAGTWQLAGTIAVDEGTDLPLPADVAVGPMRLAFTKVRATPSALLVEMRIQPNGLDLARLVPDAGKGHSAFTLRLRDEVGSEVTLLQGQYGSSADGVDGAWMWLIERAGRYQLEISYAGVGSVTRTLDVP